MTSKSRALRQSVSLPPRLARQVRQSAKSRRTSANQVLVELIEAGVEARRREKERFFALADQLVRATDPSEQQRLKAELARMTFGE